MIQQRGGYYFLRLKKRDVDAMLLFLGFWFIWRERNALSQLFGEIFQAVGG